MLIELNCFLGPKGDGGGEEDSYWSCIKAGVRVKQEERTMLIVPRDCGDRAHLPPRITDTRCYFFILSIQFCEPTGGGGTTITL